MEETTAANNNNNNNNNNQGHGAGRHSLLTRSVGQADVSMSRAQQIYQNEPDQTSKNKRLLSMGLGIKGCNVLEEPFTSAADKKRFTPLKNDWKREADRRFALRGERARLNPDRAKADMNTNQIKEWLLNHPLEDPADVEFIQRKVAELKQTLRPSPQKRAKQALQRTSHKAKTKVHDAMQRRVDVGMESLGYLSAFWNLSATRRASSSTTTLNDAPPVTPPPPHPPQPQQPQEANHARPDDALGHRIPSVVGSNERGHRFSMPHFISDYSVLSPSFPAIIQPWVHDNDYNENDDDDDSDDDNEEDDDDTMDTFRPDKSLGNLSGIGSKSFFSSSSGQQILSFRSCKKTPSSSSSFGSRSVGSSFYLMDMSVVRTPSTTSTMSATAANNDRSASFSWSTSLARDSNSRHLEQKENFEEDDEDHHHHAQQQQPFTTMMEEDASNNGPTRLQQQQQRFFQELVTDPEYRVSEVTRSFQQCTGLVSRTPSVEDLSQWSGQLSIGGGRSLDVSMVSYRSKCPYSNYHNNNNNNDDDDGIGSSSSSRAFWAEWAL